MCFIMCSDGFTIFFAANRNKLNALLFELRRLEELRRAFLYKATNWLIILKLNCVLCQRDIKTGKIAFADFSDFEEIT